MTIVANEADSPANSWWAREDSNLQPSGYEPLALTIELRARAALLSSGERECRRQRQRVSFLDIIHDWCERQDVAACPARVPFPTRIGLTIGLRYSRS